MHRLEDLSFQFYQGRVTGPKVFRSETLAYRGTRLDLCIVGASHLLHFETPWGTFTEAVADPSRLPQSSLHQTTLSHPGNWQSPDVPYAIQWKTVSLSEDVLAALKSYPLVYDFGGNALTALKWELGDELKVETAHVYPEAKKVVLTESRMRLKGMRFDTSVQTKACLAGLSVATSTSAKPPALGGAR